MEKNKNINNKDINLRSDNLFFCFLMIKTILISISISFWFSQFFDSLIRFIFAPHTCFSPKKGPSKDLEFISVDLNLINKSISFLFSPVNRSNWLWIILDNFWFSSMLLFDYIRNPWKSIERNKINVCDSDLTRSLIYCDSHLLISSSSSSSLVEEKGSKMTKEKPNRTYDNDGFRRRAACICVRDPSESEVCSTNQSLYSLI